MEPIDVRVETTFAQALRCVQYRLPSPDGFRSPGFILAVGARYGLIGVAAVHHLLLTAANDAEEKPILDSIESWETLVTDHIRWDVAHRLPFAVTRESSQLVGRVASLPLRSYLPLYRRLCPLSMALELVGQALASDHRTMVWGGWGWLQRKAAMRCFRSSVRESKEYAIHF
ncbi:MAG TPA: hypothetical protein VMI31_05795, partial [Fimbriimonadaceae bacterium]|nr:hypothetical protein [Fimbriimonadaceae bacterium]